MTVAELAPGSAFGADGRYRIERLLATGGMASVWLGHDTRLHRQVAMKFLADVLALDRDYVTRFAREARVAAQLSHPHLVSIYDFSGEATRPFLVMEYISGGSLAGRLHDLAALDLDPEQVIHDLLGALNYIHEAGVIHRDIKPANVLLGPDGRIRLTDFGIAQPSAATSITKTGIVLGTARYLAPEVLRGEPADQRSDLYSCGVLLAQMLPQAPPPALALLAQRLTAPEPGQRPGSAAEALSQLNDAGLPGRRPAPETAPTKPVAMPRMDGTGPTRRAAVTRPTAASGTPRPRRATQSRRIPRGGGIGLRLTRRTLALLAGLAAIVVVIVVLASAGGGPSSPASRSALPAPPARRAPLRQQLDYLDRAINAARR